MRVHALSVRQVLLSLCLVLLMPLAFSSSCKAAAGRVVENSRNYHYYTYEVELDDGSMASFPVPNGYVPMEEKDNPYVFRKEIERYKKAGDTLLGIFIFDGDKSLELNKNPRKIVYYFNKLGHKESVGSFLRNKSSMKRVRDYTEKYINNEYKRENNKESINLRYIYDTKTSLSYVLFINGREYPMNTYAQSLVLSNGHVYNMTWSSRVFSALDMVTFINSVIHHIKSFP